MQDVGQGGNDEWLAKRLAYLRGLKAPSDQQRLLLALAEKPERSAQDARQLAALVRAEKAAERAQKARADAARIVNAEKVAQRKARDHALYRSAGLMILAGLVDPRTGLPVCDRGVLLGGLAFVAQVIAQQVSSDVQDGEGLRRIWKAQGDALLAGSAMPATGAPGGSAPLAGDAVTVGAAALDEVAVDDGEAEVAARAQEAERDTTAGLSAESLMERLDYGSQGRTAADRQSVAALVERFGAQEVDNNIAELRAQGGKVYPSTLWKRMMGSAQETRQP